jgi:type IV secretion system protein TrbL
MITPGSCCACSLIQLVWTFAPLVMRGAELGDILHELVKFIL